MSRRSRLATVVRVADLRETIARGQVAAAGAATARAVQDEQARREALAAARLDGTALHASAALLAWRAEAVARLQADQRAADDSTGARHVRGGAA